MVAVGIAVLIGLAILAVTEWGPAGPQEQALGGLSIGGPFSLTDQTGKPVTDASFRGRLMLVYFGYTFCPDVCPTTLTKLSQGLNLLRKDQRAAVAPIFISIDPGRDTVTVMRDYVTNFAPDLIGLTGGQDQIDAVAKEYHVYAKKVGDGANYTMDHSSILYLMGKDGRYLANLSADSPPDEIAAALRKYL